MKTFREFIDFTHSLHDKSLLEDFMFGITTPKEQQELMQRFAIIEKLLQGVPHQQIASELGVGVATVTRGAKELTAGRFKALRDL